MANLNNASSSWSSGLCDCTHDVRSSALLHALRCFSLVIHGAIQGQEPPISIPPLTRNRQQSMEETRAKIANQGCLTLFCRCVVFGRIAEIIDKGATSCCKSGTAYTLLASATGLGGCLYSFGYRSRLREQYGLGEKPCGDCCVHWFCEPCALCQEYRELQSRGFDMALGWQANMERMGKSGATTAPQTHPGMTR